MKNVALSTLTIVFALGTTAHEFSAEAQNSVLECYAWSAFPNERLKLNIKLHSPLTEPEEEKKFDHRPQTVFSVHGKEIGGCGGNTMAAVTGTVVTAKGGGSHMGIVAHFSRGSGQFFGRDSCRSITFDCTTKEEGPAPDRWQCQSRNEFDVYHGISELKKVDETQDPRCSIFQNGSFTRAQAQSQKYEPDQRSSAAIETTSGGPATISVRAEITSGGPIQSQGEVSALRVGGRGGLGSAVACYYGWRGNGADDLTSRFFCGLRPFPPWLLVLDSDRIP